MLSEHKAKYDIFFISILIIPLAVLGYAAILIGSDEAEAAWVLAGTIIFIVLLFWSIMPRRFLILSDRIKFVMGRPLSFSINFNNIKTARELKGITFGINFTTSFSDPVEIIRNKGMRINISPEDRGKFLYDLNNAIQTWRRNLQSR